LGLSAGYNQQAQQAQRPRDGTQSVDHRLSPLCPTAIPAVLAVYPSTFRNIRWPDNESNVRFRGSATMVRGYRFQTRRPRIRT
jgi:hypothetical protein